LRNKAFDPPVVAVHEGDTVVWVNETKGGWHDVHSHEGLFASGHLEYGGVFQFTFTAAGVYGILCSPHVIDGMQGAVVVLPRGEPLPDPLPAPAALSASPVSAAPAPPGAADTIQTIGGSAGTGGPASDAALYLPEGVAVHDQGLYVADTGNCQVRHVDRSGALVSILGHDSCGYSMGADGDLGPWLHANRPTAVAAGEDGNVYVSDTLNCRIRRVQGDGHVTVVAGNGSCRASGDGGPAASAGLSPWGLAFDTNGDLFVADVFNCRVRRIDAAGVITTVAGDGTCGFSGDGGPGAAAQLRFPRDVSVGSDGALYIADTDNCRVRRLQADVIESIAGDGTCDDVRPWAVAAAVDGILVADRDSCRISRLTADGRFEAVAGTGACAYAGDGSEATRAALNTPSDLAIDQDGAVLIAETGSCRVRRVASGRIDTVAGSGACALAGDGGSAVGGGAWHPFGLETAADGSWLFSELDTCRVRRVAANGIVTTIAGTGVCGYGGDGGPATQAMLGDVGGLALASNGSLYVADGHNCRVRKVDPAGTVSTVAGNGACDFAGDRGPATEAALQFVSDVAIDGHALYIADPWNCRVRAVDLATGDIDTLAGDGSCDYNGERIDARSAGIDPQGVAAGADGGVYIADGGNCRLRRIHDGRISTIAGSGTCGYGGDGGPGVEAQLFRPQDVAADRDGNVYVTDVRTFRVRKVDLGGTITTVAGIGVSRPVDIGGFDPTNGLLCSLHNLPLPQPSYLNDGQAATEAGLYFPYAIAVGVDGHLYIADTFDHRVRRVACGGSVPCAGPAVLPGHAPGHPVDQGRRDQDLRLPVTGQAGRPRGSTAAPGLLGAMGALLLLAGASRLPRARGSRRRAGERRGEL